MSVALVTGIAGQDGSYLTELLLNSGYTVIGTVSDVGTGAHPNIRHLLDSIQIANVNLLDQTGIEAVLRRFRPTEIYNFAALHPSSTQSYDPILSGEVNGLAVLRLLEAVKAVDPTIRFCQASTAQIFGRPRESPQNEATPVLPDNPYGIAKLYAQLAVAHYRETYGLFACSGILFNHESPRRPEKFVTRKISSSVARIKAGLQHQLFLEDLEARRDWGYAPEYVQAMWSMLQAAKPDDYVLATGKTHSVREFCRIAFEHVGLDYARHVTQQGWNERSSKSFDLIGDSDKARHSLGWTPTISFEELVRRMVDSDIELLAQCPQGCDGLSTTASER